MAEANGGRQPPDYEVLRARRIEVVDGHDRVRVVIGQQPGVGTHGLGVFGIALHGSNGSVRADLTDDAAGARLAFIASGNAVLRLGAEDLTTLIVDRGGDDLVYLPVGDPRNEVTRSGPYVVFHAGDGTPAFGWRVDAAGAVEPVPGQQ